jgi:methylaspartate ammonia-lyase
MPDDLKNRGRPDRDRINVNADHELRNSAQKFGVKPDELKEAVKRVGDRAEAVKEHLAGRGQGRR